MGSYHGDLRGIHSTGFLDLLQFIPLRVYLRVSTGVMQIIQIQKGLAAERYLRLSIIIELTTIFTFISKNLHFLDIIVYVVFNLIFRLEYCPLVLLRDRKKRV